MRAVNEAWVYGGMWSTDNPDLNTLLRIGGDVYAGRWGSTCRKVDGGINAVQDVCSVAHLGSVKKVSLPTPLARFHPPQTSSSPTTPRSFIIPTDL
jgi:hypothetical protein